MSRPPPAIAELERIAILMPSCDRYASLWPISLTALERYWPGRPPATYLVTNHAPCDHPGVRVVQIGTDVSWSDNLLIALAEVREDYVFLALDDLVMLPGVRSERVNTALARAVREDWDYLRINPLPAPRSFGLDGLGRSLPGEAYRSATIWSLWRKTVLKEVLKPGENAWQFEKTGSARTDHFDQWWASAEWNVPYLNVVTAGRADPDALRKLREIGFDPTEIAFPPMNTAEYRRHRWRLLRSKALKLVPRGLRRAVLSVLARP